ncbi:MAG: toll/interleukin-1 receptor domain-containing protein [Lachnospiraceae bacterium]|nr:toll/interleukin-1 receptor domain-containing protein [Lachnospiraceae bacterium]
MNICPFCASENIFFSKKRSTYICEDCEETFLNPAEEGGFRLFISYGHDKNAAVVKKIKTYLSAHGYDVWIDTSEITPGKDWRERITSGLLGSNGVISFLSRHSVRNPGVCLDELKIAFRIKRAYLKPVLLENENEISLPPMVSHIQWIDLSQWNTIPAEQWDAYFEEKMAELLAALRSEDATEYSHEMDFLSEQLRTVSNHTKEQFLLRQTFVGRAWLTKRIYEWLQQSDKPAFMIYGVPGAGKSAFAANLIQYDPNVVGNIIFEWDHSELRDVDSVIYWLAFELAANLYDYRKMLLNMLRNKETKKIIEQLHHAALFDQLILNPIQCCIDGARGTVLVLFDGLDETTPEVAELLLNKSDKFPEWMKFLFTARYDESYDRYFDDSCVVSLSGTYEENLSDIMEYLIYRLNLEKQKDLAKKLAEKTEGSFLYAVAFCDAVESGAMSLADEKRIPRGMNSFYWTFFRRTFPTRETFLQAKPLLELLVTEEAVPEQVVCDALGFTRHELWELRFALKSLVVKTESTCGSGGICKFKALKLVHKSIQDWMTDEKFAKEFYVDAKEGYLLLVKYAEEVAAGYGQSERTWFEILKNGGINGKRNEKNPGALDQTERLALKRYAENQYIRWLIKSGNFEKAKETLLDSFDEKKMDLSHDRQNYQEYYKFFDFWQWADEFPLEYPIPELVDKVEQMALYPHKYLVSRYAHRSFQIIFLIFRYIMDSGRYASAFYAFVRRMNYAGYFASRASDDGETRDGWDKYYMARDVSVCIKKLQKNHIEIPPDVLESCEQMKLTYSFYQGKPDGGMFQDSWGIQREPELMKDICVVQNGSVQYAGVKIIQLQADYNTTTLWYYLANSDEEDLEFIQKCVACRADLFQACKLALLNMEKQTGYPHKKLKNKDLRVKFIEKLLE